MNKFAFLLFSSAWGKPCIALSTILHPVGDDIPPAPPPTPASDQDSSSFVEGHFKEFIRPSLQTEETSVPLTSRVYTVPKRPAPPIKKHGKAGSHRPSLPMIKEEDEGGKPKGVLYVPLSSDEQALDKMNPPSSRPRAKIVAMYNPLKKIHAEVAARCNREDEQGKRKYVTLSLVEQALDRVYMSEEAIAIHRKLLKEQQVGYARRLEKMIKVKDERFDEFYKFLGQLAPADRCNIEKQMIDNDPLVRPQKNSNDEKEKDLSPSVYSEENAALQLRINEVLADMHDDEFKNQLLRQVMQQVETAVHQRA